MTATLYKKFIMRKLTKKPDSFFTPLVGNGAIATSGVGDGRMIPVLIVDCKNKTEIEDLISSHTDSNPGDVISTWGWPRWNNNLVYLILKFTKPANIEFGLKFNVMKDSALVDSILHTNAIYLQSSSSGRSLSDGLDGEKIIVEIPNTDFLPRWDKIYEKCLIKKFKKSGLSRRVALEASRQHKESMRKIWKRRMPS